MAGIRIQGTQTVENQTGAPVLNRTQATGADFGGEVFGKVAEQARALSDYAFKSANLAAIQEAESKQYAWENEALFGDNGLYRAKGKDALGKADEIMSAFDKHSQEVMAGLTNDVQRRAFLRLSNDRRNSLLSTSTKYQFSEAQSYKEKQHQAYLQNSLLSAATHWNEPDRIDHEIRRQDGAILEHAELNGLSPEETKLQLLQAHSSTYSTVIGEMLNNKQYGLAQSYFDKNKEQLLPDARANVERQLSIGRVRAVSQGEADRIMSNSLTKEEALKEARSIKDPEIRDNTVQRVKVRYGEIEQLDLAKSVKISSDIVTQIDNGEEVNIPMLSGLGDNLRKSLMNYQLIVSTGGILKTTPSVKFDLDYMAINNPGSFVRTNLYSYRDKLSDKDFNDYITKQSKLSHPSQKEHSPTSLFSDITMVKNAAGQFGIIDNAKTKAKQSDEDKHRYYVFQQMVNEELMSEQEQKGKPLTDAEKQNIINKAAARFSIGIKEKDWIFDNDKKLGDLTTEQLQSGDYYLADEEERNRLKILLINQGIDPTEQNIIYAKSRGL